MDHWLRVVNANRKSLYDALVEQHWRLTPFLTLPSGNQPPSAVEHIILLQDAGVDVEMLAAWLAGRATGAVDVVEGPAVPMGDEPEFGDDFFGNDDDAEDGKKYS